MCINFHAMYIKRHPIVYQNPQPAPRYTQQPSLFGFDSVMVSLRRIKLIAGFAIIAEQDVVDDRRIISWRVGNTCDSYCMIISYNFTFTNEWFTIMDSPTCVVDEPIIESLFERGEEIHGPNGAYSFDEQSVICVLDDIENTAEMIYG